MSCIHTYTTYIYASIVSLLDFSGLTNEVLLATPLRAVSNQLLKTKALQIAGGLKLEGFRASCGWLSRWKRRYAVGVRAGINSAQRLPADYADHLHTFRKSVIVIGKAENIGPDDITNMDQTMCRFDIPPSRTNNKRGERTIRIKTTHAEKKEFTVPLPQRLLERNFQL